MAAFKEPKKFNVVPGNAADVTAIQDAASVLNPSMADIFPAIYQVPLGQGGKAPERTTFNQFFKLYGEALYFLQRGGVWSYDATADYPAGAVVGYSGGLYLALGDNGPGTGTGAVTPGKNTSVWQKFLTSHQSLSNYVTLNGAQTISGAKTFTGDVIGISKNNSTEDANSLYSTTAGSKLTYYTTSNGFTRLTNVPAAVSTTLESRTIRRLSDSDWIVEQICHNSNGLYYRKGINGTWDAWKTFAFTDSNISGNAATATKLATARTIALSGAATGTATGFDGSGNITIPVTALSGSAITSAITIYDLVPDGAANHRNFYRGKDITAAFNAGTVSANIANGTFRDIFPGDYITKQITVPRILKADGTTEYIAQTTYTVKFIIADLDVWLNRGDTATTVHHAAIVPERVVFNSCMNETNVTDGGYVGSFMNTHVMPAFATGLQNAFGASHLISFRIGLSNGVTTTTASASHPYWTGTSNWWGAWTSEICCLMSEGMVYGQSPNHSAAMDETMCGQFAAFRLNSNLVYNRQNYWLSDVVSSALFAFVTGDGIASAHNASSVLGVRPFALLV